MYNNPMYTGACIMWLETIVSHNLWLITGHADSCMHALQSAVHNISCVTKLYIAMVCLRTIQLSGWPLTVSENKMIVSDDNCRLDCVGVDVTFG